MSAAAPAGLTSSSLFTRVCPGPSAPDGALVMRQFPPRERPGWWPGTAVGREEARALLTAPSFRLGSRGGQQQRGRILGQVLDWLGGQPGGTWQERWAASGAGQAGAGWREIAAGWLSAAGRAPAGGPRGSGLGAGLLLLICGDLIRPDPGWLLASSGLQLLTSEMARTRDPAAFAALRRACEVEQVSPLTRDLSLRRIAAIVAAKGGLVRDITAGDCLELAATARSIQGKTRSAGMHFYQLLRTAGVLPPEAPASVRMFATRGQLTPAELIGQYGIECVPIRDLLVSYLRERHLAADYSTLRTIAHILGRLFWRDLERHHPGISSLRLSPAQVAGWKDRITRKAPRGTAGGPESPRTAAANALFTVRAFYLDIAQWAVDDPSRWAQWAAPCPIRPEEIPHAKELSRRKARMDQRTRERLPVLPVLVRSAEDGRHTAAERLAACAAAAPGQAFTAGGRELRRAVMATGDTARTWAEDPADGRRRDLTLEEHRAFWAWAAIEVLRHTRHQDRGAHRAVAPQPGPVPAAVHRRAHPAAADRPVQDRRRTAPGHQPRARQCPVGDHHPDPRRPRRRPARRVLRRQREALEPADAAAVPAPAPVRGPAPQRAGDPGTPERRPGRVRPHRRHQAPLRFAPHDFRRMLITDAIMHGMPPHIAQLVAGHRDINTTMGYKAVYPEEIITGHRAFIARRRALRPSAEYRTPTDGEWEEFLGHFERRKLALGDCGRAYGTSCIHEHAASAARCCASTPPSGTGSRKYATASPPASPRPNARAGPAKQKASRSASPPPTPGSPRPTRARNTAADLGIPAYRDIAGRLTTGPAKTMTAPSVPAALRACAAGIYTHEAGVSLLIANRAFLSVGVLPNVQT